MKDTANFLQHQGMVGHGKVGVGVLHLFDEGRIMYEVQRGNLQFLEVPFQEFKFDGTERGDIEILFQERDKRRPQQKSRDKAIPGFADTVNNFFDRDLRMLLNRVIVFH